MKRITFIAPVESMQGNLTRGKNVNVYDSLGTPAYDMGSTGTYHAVNFKPCYIGARRASDGKLYFSMRKKATVNLAATKFAMAAFGGACSCTQAVSIDLIVFPNLQKIYKNLGGKATLGKAFRGWLTSKIVPMLSDKEASVTITDGASNPTTVVLNNPWIEGGTGQDIAIPQEIETKFASELGA